MATPARPLHIITPTYPAANATFISSHSTLSVMTKEIQVAHALMQSITEGKGSVSQLFDPADFFKGFSNFVELKVTVLVVLEESLRTASSQTVSSNRKQTSLNRRYQAIYAWYHAS
jgi:poly(A) polymerase Pap1